jgi:hypothetical protein
LFLFWFRFGALNITHQELAHQSVHDENSATNQPAVTDRVQNSVYKEGEICTLFVFSCVPFTTWHYFSHNFCCCFVILSLPVLNGLQKLLLKYSKLFWIT